MSQISPPIRVLAVCAVALLAAYMLFLRPKPAEVATPTGTEPAAATPAPTAEPGSAAGEAVAQANGAAAAADARAGDLTGEGGSAPATAGTPGGATPAGGEGEAPEADPEALRKLPAGVRRAIRRDKVLVLLFWNRGSAEDRRVKRTLARVDRWHGRVFVADADVRKVARYAAITRGADVEQSPSVIVVDRDLKAETLVGFVDRPTIDQAVLDALREPAALFPDPYLRKVNAACRILNDAFVPEPEPDASGRRVAAWLRTLGQVLDRFDRELVAIAAPARWRDFERFAHGANRRLRAELGGMERLVRSGSRRELLAFLEDADEVAARMERLSRRYDERTRGKHLLGCSPQD